jgi:hypothetical protein
MESAIHERTAFEIFLAARAGCQQHAGDARGPRRANAPLASIPHGGCPRRNTSRKKLMTAFLVSAGVRLTVVPVFASMTAAGMVGDAASIGRSLGEQSELGLLDG